MIEQADFRAALSELRPPPCEAPVRCQHYERCASQHLACDLFNRYIYRYRGAGKASRQPTSEVYARIFPGDDEPIAPSRPRPLTFRDILKRLQAAKR